MTKTDQRAAREKRRRLENRETILHAAESVLLRKGVSAMSMDDVAAAAQFSKATLYRYFRTKAELVFEILTHFLEDLDDRLAAAMARPAGARERLRAWIETSLRYLSQKENMTRVFLLDRSFMRLLEIFVGKPGRTGTEAEKSFLRKVRAKRAEMNRRALDLLRGGIASGEFRPVDPAAGVMVLEAIIEGYFVERFWAETKTDLERDIESIDDFLGHSLGLAART